MIQTLPQTELSQSPDLLRHIPPTAIPASSRSVSSDQLPRRAISRNTGSSAMPTISCPYYKSELYIVSEEQAFRSQQGHPFRNDDVADCIAIASSTPPSVTLPHRSCLRTPDVAVGRIPHRSHVDSQQPDFMMRRSYSSSVSPSSTSGGVTSSVPVTASASSLSSVQHNWPTSTNRQSMTESKWKWLHSNAMVPEQSSPISLRRATQLDIPSTTLQSSTSSLRQDFRQQSAGSLTTPVSRRISDDRLADTQDQGRASRLYSSKPVVDSSAATGEHPQRRKTTLDLIQSVSDVHRSVVDKSVRHWRHSSDNTARHSTADPGSSKWDNYGLTVSLSGAAVPRSDQTLGNNVKKFDVDLDTNKHPAASTGDLPNKLPIERIMRFEDSDVVLDHVGHQPSSTRHAKPDSTSTKHPASSENALRSGRMSIPDSIPIYFRAEPSVTDTKAGQSDSKIVPYSTDGHKDPVSVASSHSSASCGMYIPVLVI